VVDGIGVATVRACGVVISSDAKAAGVGCIKCMACDELECGRLVQVGIGSEDSLDEVGNG
jgi:hypothetical protein